MVFDIKDSSAKRESVRPKDFKDDARGLESHIHAFVVWRKCKAGGLAREAGRCRVVVKDRKILTGRIASMNTAIRSTILNEVGENGNEVRNSASSLGALVLC